jgi:hypothetical protein
LSSFERAAHGPIASERPPRLEKIGLNNARLAACATPV